MGGQHLGERGLAAPDISGDSDMHGSMIDSNKLMAQQAKYKNKNSFLYFCTNEMTNCVGTFFGCSKRETIMMHVKIFRLNRFQTNSILFWDDDKVCGMVDPAFYEEDEEKEFFKFISDNNLKPDKVLLTHGHFDHLFGVKKCCDKFGICACLNPKDKPLLKMIHMMCSPFGFKEPDVTFPIVDIEEGMTIRTGAFCFEVLSTPGHSAGSVCFLCKEEKIMFSGDTLFAGTIGRTDLAFGDYDQLINSLMTKLVCLDPDIAFIPGHGEDSSIADERTKNPFLQPFNEPEEEGNVSGLWE